MNAANKIEPEEGNPAREVLREVMQVAIIDVFEDPLLSTDEKKRKYVTEKQNEAYIECVKHI